MTFAIASAILALAILLVPRLGIDRRAGGAGTLVMCIHVRDVNDKSRTCGSFLRRAHSVRCGDPMNPDHVVAVMHLGVNDGTVAVTVLSAPAKSECLHEKVLTSNDVF